MNLMCPLPSFKNDQYMAIFILHLPHPIILQQILDI